MFQSTDLHRAFLTHNKLDICYICEQWAKIKKSKPKNPSVSICWAVGRRVLLNIIFICQSLVYSQIDKNKCTLNSDVTSTNKYQNFHKATLTKNLINEDRHTIQTPESFADTCCYFCHHCCCLYGISTLLYFISSLPAVPSLVFLCGKWQAQSLDAKHTF